MKHFSARYPGRCGNCDFPFAVGDPVFYVDGVLYAFDGCDAADKAWPAEQTPEEIRAAMCPKCFMVHAGECL